MQENKKNKKIIINIKKNNKQKQKKRKAKVAKKNIRLVFPNCWPLVANIQVRPQIRILRKKSSPEPPGNSKKTGFFDVFSFNILFF